MRSGQKLFNLP